MNSMHSAIVKWFFLNAFTKYKHAPRLACMQRYSAVCMYMYEYTLCSWLSKVKLYILL